MTTRWSGADCGSCSRFRTGSRWQARRGVAPRGSRRPPGMAAEHAPDVILLDLKLPGADGIAVLGELKVRDSAARVLVLTSATEPAAASLAVRSGAAGVLYKDVDPDALVRAIRSVHDGHLLLAAEAA